ncbi:MAG TPA: hypothetical protein VGG46_04130 [Terriglobales bacterium]
MNFFRKIFRGIEWFGKEVGKAFTELPKIIRLTKDGEKVAQNAIPETIAVLKDAGALSTAVVKDSGVFLIAFANLTGAITIAIAAKALNISADAAVVAAFEAFVKDFNAENVQDMIAAIDQLVADTRTLDSTVLAGLKQLEADAKS